MSGSLVEISPFARKVGAYASLASDDLDTLSALCRNVRSFPPGYCIIHEGQPHPTAFIIVSGWAYSYKTLRRGTRQIVDIRIPGDYSGFRSILFRSADHNAETITDVHTAEVRAVDLFALYAHAPRLAAALSWAASRDEAMLIEHLVGLGRRNALERTAHFFLELWARLQLVGMTDERSYACPLSQYLLADTLGLTPVHVNRVLRELREERLLTFHRGRVDLGDMDRLIHLADFDITYLDQLGPRSG